MNFKKLSVTALVCFLMTGCSSTSGATESVEVYEDGEYVVSSLTDKNFTALELYETMISSTAGENAVFEAVMQQIMDSKTPVSEEMELDAQLLGEQIETSYQSYYGEEWESQLVYALVSSGYNSVEEYCESIVLSLQYSEFLNTYVEANFDAVLDDYVDYLAPRFLSTIFVAVADMESITDEEQATLDEVTALVNSSKEFSETATEYSTDTSASNAGSLGLIAKNTDLATTYGEDFETAALALSTGEYTEEPIEGESGYYFIKCDSFDKEDIREYVKDLGVDSPLISYDSYMLYEVYNTYEVSYDDSEVQAIVEKVVETQLAAKAELRGEE